MSRTTGDNILSKFTGGQQNLGTMERSGEFCNVFVDGFDPLNKIVYEFLGCFWHGHCCKLNSSKQTSQSKQKYEETLKRHCYLRNLGLKVRSVWECEWDVYIKENAQVQVFLKETFEIGDGKASKTATEIVGAVKTEDFFGLLEIDIETPDHLKKYFEDLPPIFKNADVSRADIGKVMREYATKNNIMNRPRRLLISSYFGKKILINSELLKWYLSKGLVVTRLYQAFQFKPSFCFKGKGDVVSFHRRAADKDPDKAVIADMFKTTGNWLVPTHYIWL